MKNLILLLTITLLNINLLTAKDLGDGSKKCLLEVIHTTTTLSLDEQLRKDLLSGIWTIDNSDRADQASMTSLQFSATGLVGMITQVDEKVLDYRHQIWRMESSEIGLLFLVLMDQQKEHTYAVKRHCNHLSLTHLTTGEVIELFYTSNQEAKQLKATKKTLSGVWKSTIFPESTAAKQQNISRIAYQYELKKDGTIEKSCSAENLESIVQYGFWQVSPDGQYLILHFQDGAQFQTSIAKINYLAFDELVLSEIVATSSFEKTWSVGIDSFYFNKQ